MAERLTSHGEETKRLDQSEWRIFPLERGAVVITGTGQDLLAEQPSFASILHTYRTDVINQGRTPPVQRRYFKHGGNSDVYEVGDTSLVVKESTQAQSTWYALERMDYLQTICEASLPSHIQVPKHYGAIFSADLERQYLFMQKANEGATVEDIQENPVYPQRIQDAVTAEFHRSKTLLDTAIAEASASTGVERTMLPDWHAGNVIVDFSTPNPQFPFTLWVIDQ